MTENKKDKSTDEVKTTGHIYDGIEELDNSPPRWFHALFYGTIVFGLIYHFYFTIGWGDSIEREYAKDVQAEEVSAFTRLASESGGKQRTEDEFKAMLTDPEMKKLGTTAYQSKCISCHGAQGQGGIGPNLTDAYWIHGGKMTDMHKIITKGVAEKGMPAWGAMLQANEAEALTVYVKSLAGTNPAGAKAPQGELFNQN